MDLMQHIAGEISRNTGQPFNLKQHSGVSGGCINSAMRIVDGDREFFVKTNHAAKLDMFQAEAQGLSEMGAVNAIRVPGFIACDKAENTAYIVLEYINLGGGQSGGQREFGRQLAQMHRATQQQYGWHRDNTIGATPQRNTLTNTWSQFWLEHRLGYQLQLAAKGGYGSELQRKGERCMGVIGKAFQHYQPQASLLHGDLWSGNYGFDNEGNPVIYDPAVYYGDREADIAMTELFGGFGRDFYSAYNDTWPMDKDYAYRKTIYNLYHIINHLNLFGGGYLTQSLTLMDRIISDIG